jgi:hypothetical protein
MQLDMPDGPKLWLFGDVEQSDFRESVALIRRTTNVGPGPPELIILAESRPGTIRRREYERLRRAAPLAAVVSLCGSWCEGELRTGRPLTGATRLYWYEFPTWWRRQLELHASGRCPEWAGNDDCGLRIADCRLGGRVAVSADCWDKFDVLADALEQVKLKAVWIRSPKVLAVDESVHAGIWDGGQLSEPEADRLAAFCDRMSLHNAPVIALLDFPRKDRCALAGEIGAAAVLGKPWANNSLITTLLQATGARTRSARVA